MKISPVIYPKQTSFKSSERTRYYTKSNGEYLRPYYSVFEDYISFMDGINPNYNCVRIVNSIIVSESLIQIKQIFSEEISAGDMKAAGKILQII